MIIGISGKSQSGKDLVGKIIQYLTHCKNDDTTWEDWNNFIHYDLGDWRIKKFAAKVKQILSILTGISIEDFEKEEVKNSYLGEEWNYVIIGDMLCTVQDYYNYIAGTTYLSKKEDIQRMTVRQALQWIGTDLFRNKFHPQTWCNALFSEYKLNTIIRNGQKYRGLEFPSWIITDCRFPNEAKAIKDRGGILIRVNRSVCPKCGEEENFHWDIVTHRLEYCNECGYRWNTHESETALDNYNFDYEIDNSETIEKLIEKVKEILIKEKLI